MALDFTLVHADALGFYIGKAKDNQWLHEAMLLTTTLVEQLCKSTQ